MLLRTAKPCGPGTRCWCQVGGGASARPGLDNPYSPTTVTRRIRRRGERDISRKTIARGMPECSDCTCMLVYASSHNFAHETAGAASTRHSLRPLFSLGEMICKTRAHRAARTRNCVHRHCEERSDEAIHSSFVRQDGLLRGACHRARIRATRWLAMTVSAVGGQSEACPPFRRLRAKVVGTTQARLCPSYEASGGLLRWLAMTYT